MEPALSMVPIIVAANKVISILFFIVYLHFVVYPCRKSIMQDKCSDRLSETSGAIAEVIILL
jgi:hypothetical protein